MMTDGRTDVQPDRRGGTARQVDHGQTDSRTDRVLDFGWKDRWTDKQTLFLWVDEQTLF